MKVSVVNCKKYDYDMMKAAIELSIANLGGLEKYINKGEKVLLKVNMLAKRPPEAATTTHPAVVQALSELLINYGAQVVIGDSPGGPFTESILTGCYKVCGFAAVAEKTGAKLNYNVGQANVKNPSGLVLKNLTIADMLNDVDKVISVSKLKTHSMAVFTGAVKNMYGCVPGILKAEYHVTMKEMTTFADCLIDICTYANPVLSFMDAVIGMEGAGPSNGTPRKIGAILASDSPYHLDLCATHIINLDYKQVPILKRCVDRKIIAGDFSDIELSGDDIQKLVIKDYDIPKATANIMFNINLPKPLEKIVDRHLKPRPKFIHAKCIGCKICAKNCPPKVIRMKDKLPYVKLDGCIRCFCCQELCPKNAVEVYVPTISKVLFNKNRKKK